MRTALTYFCGIDVHSRQFTDELLLSKSHGFLANFPNSSRSIGEGLRKVTRTYV